MPGKRRRSICKLAWPQILLGLSPARMQPLFIVGTFTAKASFLLAAASSARISNNALITLCVASKALLPKLGSEEFPAEPKILIDIMLMHFWANVGCSSVSSPTIEQLAVGLPDSTKYRPPAKEDSSSEVATMVSGALGWPLAKVAAAPSATGKIPSCHKNPNRKTHYLYLSA